MTKGTSRSESVALGSMRPDPAIAELQGIDSSVVTRYALAMKAGDDFPMMTATPDGRVILGLHRHQALLKVYGEKHKVPVRVRDFGGAGQELLAAASDNARNPRALTGFIRHRVAEALLYKHGFKLTLVCRVFGVPTNLSEKQLTVALLGQQVVMRCGKKSVHKCCKGGASPDEVTRKQLTEHIKHDIGVGADMLAEQLLRKLRNGWYVPSARFEKAMRALGGLCVENGWVPDGD